MNSRKKILQARLLVALIAVAALALTGTAQPSSGKLHWTLRLNETRGPVRTVDVSPISGKTAVSEVLGGPTNGSDDAFLIYTRMPSGAHGPNLFTLPVEDDYVVLSGKLTVQIGTDKFIVGPLTGVVIPANTPHEVWNADAEPEANLEVISSANPREDLSRDLMSMLKPAQARKVENAAQYIREINLPAASNLKPGLNSQIYTQRSKGSPIQLRIDSTLPGSGGPKSHVHRFEQVYFELEGETTVMYGLDDFKLRENDIVIIPPGVVHTNNNQTAGIERHIVLLLPEPVTGPFDVEFEKRGPAGANP
jgi:mannose-6-phosphate isomerase-like protein (cupin superfamily)